MLSEIFRAHPLGRLFGVDVRIHGTTLALLAFFLLTTVLGSGLSQGAMFVVGAVVLMGSIVLHEFGHIAAARFFGIQTTGVTLYPIGGVARLTRESKSGIEEIVVAVAGPLVNAILASVGFVGLILTSGPSVNFDNPFALLFGINLVLGAFNMLPAFPMDGGRVFRGLLWSFQGKLTATRWAARLGQVFAVLFFIAGIFQSGSLALIGIFIYLQASSELARVQMTEAAQRGLVFADQQGPYVPFYLRGYDDAASSYFQGSPQQQPQVEVIERRFFLRRTPSGRLEKIEA